MKELESLFLKGWKSTSEIRLWEYVAWSRDKLFGAGVHQSCGSLDL